MIRGFIAVIFLVLVAVTSSKPSFNMKYYKKEVTPPPRSPGCDGKPADVFFLLDSSSSIWSVDFDKQLKFVSDVVDMFDIGPDRTRVGVATFSDRYNREFGLTQYLEKKELKAAIGRVSYRAGNTYTGTALQYMREKEFAPEVIREGVSKIAIVMTDGQSRNPQKTLLEAELAKLEGIHVFAIGIGNKYNYEELVKIGSEPTEKFVFKVASYDALSKHLKVELALGACEVESNPIQDHQPVCSRDTLADVMFVFDSAAMGSKKTNKIQDYIGSVVHEFNFDDEIMRAGVVSRNCHDGDIQLGEHADKDTFAKDLRNRDYPELSHVIRRMRNHSFTQEEGARELARRMAVIFVDSELEVPKRVYNEIKQAKGDDIEIFVVAIGDDVDMTEVQFMATSPDHVIQIPDYDVMKDTSSVLVDTLCSGL